MIVINSALAYQDQIAKYPSIPPYHPSEMYPEYPFRQINEKEINPVYSSVRRSLYELGLDRTNFGRPEWNPIGDILGEGKRVVIKPNFVRDFHESDGNIFSTITHPSVIRAIADYVSIALKGRGTLVIADAPQCDASDFSEFMSSINMDAIIDNYRKNNFDARLFDLRVERVLQKERGGVIIKRIPLPGDPRGYRVIDLGKDSYFRELKTNLALLCGSDYDFEETRSYHDEAQNKYLISKTVLESNLLISIPKLKTHKRTGVTLNLKNMIGVNGDKNYIPHYRTGSRSRGGDEFPDQGFLREMEGKMKTVLLPKLYNCGDRSLAVARFARNIHKRIVDKTGFAKIRSGAWHGNDTLWRAILDINNIVLYGDVDGDIQKIPTRKYLSIIDGVLGGEGEGPLNPQERHSGVLFSGLNPFIVDFAASHFMGFRMDELPDLFEAFKNHRSNIYLDGLDGEGIIEKIQSTIPVVPFKRWSGWIRGDELEVGRG